MTALDDIKMIHQRDKSDALGIAEKQHTQLRHVFEVDNSSIDFSAVKNIVYVGMGGSALAAELFFSWPEKTVPFEIRKSYTAPAHTGAGTLVIASSYSGNTEETLSAFEDARKKGAQLVVITSSGELESLASKHGAPVYKIPAGYQPRMATLYGLLALATLFDGTALVTEKNLIIQLDAAADSLEAAVKQLRPDVATKENFAKQLALELIGNSIVVYAGAAFYPAAYKWKISFNENAKTVAWCNQYPEFNHNEFLGWTSHPVEKPYKVINLLSSFEHERVNLRFEISEKLLSGKKPAAEVVMAQGDSLLEQLLWTVQLGDFVSLYVALLNGLDPTPVDIIEKLKQELKKADG